jgi:type II restriction/modification system DNA methylase subunit YeeA
MWIIDFGERTQTEAALYQAPFEYVRWRVAPLRATNRDRQRREAWWRLGRSGEDLRLATAHLTRYIATPRVSKHRIFVWVPPTSVPDSAVVAIARDDDYTFGVLHSRVHELWARGMGTQLREVESGFRYTPTTTFETFPFPHPTDEQRDDIAGAACDLDRLRQGWLNPPNLPSEELELRSLTNLYNQRPAWLADVHSRLDTAVVAAYGWPIGMEGAQLREGLLALNLARAGASNDGVSRS